MRGSVGGGQGAWFRGDRGARGDGLPSPFSFRYDTVLVIASIMFLFS